MAYRSSNKNSGRAMAYALRTISLVEAKKHTLKSELDAITYDSFSSSVESLSGFFKAYSAVLILVFMVVIAYSFI